MKLQEKLNTIKYPLLEDTIGLLNVGKASTIKEFFSTFIKDRLPEVEVIKKWHELLMEYIKDDTNIGCAIRYGNSGSKSLSLCKESGYLKLRRGWLTINTDDNFSYFYADNYLSSFIYKMALDGFVPTLDEFKELINSHKFPYGFNFHHDKQYESQYAIIPTADEPGFLGNYKLSHIFNSGRNYFVDGVNYTKIKDLSEKYFDIGSREQWNNANKIRRISISKKEKEVIIAHFLRFIHPMNYILTPSKRKHTCVCSDIGEYEILINYMKQYLKETYGNFYDEFVKKIMWNEVSAPLPVTGDEVIDISYGVMKTNNSSQPQNNNSMITYNPKDLTTFKNEFLKTKKATIVWKYKDGSSYSQTWLAKKFGEKSSLNSNICSRPRWRTKGKDGLVEVIVSIEE